LVAGTKSIEIDSVVSLVKTEMACQTVRGVFEVMMTTPMLRLVPIAVLGNGEEEVGLSWLQSIWMD